MLGNGRNTVSRTLFRKRDLTKLWGTPGELREKLGESTFALKYMAERSSLSSLPRIETFFARTAWSQTKTQVLAKKCAKLVHAHSRKPHPNIVCRLCGCTPAQISHNLSTFSDAPAHLSHKFSGTYRECPAHKFCTIFSGTWPVLKVCFCTGNECLNPRTR